MIVSIFVCQPHESDVSSECTNISTIITPKGFNQMNPIEQEMHIQKSFESTYIMVFSTIGGLSMGWHTIAPYRASMKLNARAARR